LPGGVRRNLSSGELALLRFAAQAIASIKSGTMFLFDEPETHLHPNYISMFMSMLDRLLDLTGSIAMIATHSAYVVREVPSRRVRLIAIEKDGGGVHIDPPGFQTFGASIDMISQFVFGDIAPRHRYQEILARWVEAQGPELTVEAMRDQIGEELNAETLSYLASLIRKRDQDPA
jgi:energy-coupling factor transporter ATP-binding protein EcfA2